MRLTVEPAEKCLLLADNVMDRSSVAGILFYVAGKGAVISCVFILVVWLEKRFLPLYVKGWVFPLHHTSMLFAWVCWLFCLPNALAFIDGFPLPVSCIHFCSFYVCVSMIRRVCVWWKNADRRNTDSTLCPRSWQLSLCLWIEPAVLRLPSQSSGWRAHVVAV